MNNDHKIVIFGTSAIGATLGGWLSEHYKNVYLLIRGDKKQKSELKSLNGYLHQLADTSGLDVPLNRTN